MVLKEFDLTGKVTLITGAGKGLGKAMCLTLAEAGADVVAVARTKSDVEEVAAEVHKMGRKALAISVDVSKENDVEVMARKAISEMGKVDILINNAAAHVLKPIIPLPGLHNPLGDALPYFDIPTSADDFRLMMEVNLIGVFFCVKAFGMHMLQRRSGKIINIASMGGIKVLPFHSIYGSSKAAVAFFTRCLAMEWARYNINVNAIAPGYFPTFMTAFAYKDERIREPMRQQLPLRRFGNPREIGLLAVFLASNASNYITGQVISCDGGSTL